MAGRTLYSISDHLGGGSLPLERGGIGHSGVHRCIGACEHEEIIHGERRLPRDLVGGAVLLQPLDQDDIPSAGKLTAVCRVGGDRADCSQQWISDCHVDSVLE
jgi:hypothetical protein